MKRTLLTKILFLLCALIAGSSSVWANEVTFSYGDYKGQGTSSSGSEYTMVKTDVSIAETKFYCSSSNTYAQCYANGTITITPSAGVTITQVVLTSTGTSYNGYQDSGSVTPSTGSCSASSAVVTWTGSAASAFTISHNKQIRWTSIVVTYTGGTIQPCATPTFSRASGAVLSGTTVALSTSTSDATIYYTMGDAPADPTSSSTEYTAPIAITEATTIKAIAVKSGNSDSEVASASYTIMSAPSPNPTAVNSDYYTLVENANDLADGDAILIVSGDKAMSTTQNTNNRASVDVSIVDDAINNPSGVQKLILAKSGGYYFFYTGGDGYLYAASSSSNYLRTKTAVDMNAAATISIASGGEATITFNGPNSRNYMRFNSPNFACYATGSSTGTAVKIYKEVVKPAGVKNAAEFSFPQTSYKVAKDVEPFTAPTVSTAAGYDGSITYSSSSVSVATVDPSTGAVTIVGAGSTTITASAAETANFYEDEASYTLNVYEIEDGVFEFAKGNYRSGAEPGTSSTSTIETTWTAGNVTMAVAGKNIWYNGETLRLYGHLESESDPNNAGNITISVPAGYIITKITGISSLTPSVGNVSSSIWTPSGTLPQSVKFTRGVTGGVTLSKITVYYSQPTFNITMGDAGWMTYFNVAAALSFGDLKAYKVSAIGANSVTLAEITEAPANTPVILNGTPGSHTLTVLESATAVSGNKLQRSDGTIKNTDSRDIYALAKIDGVVGFYKMEDEVTVPADRCYLYVSKTSSPEFLSFDFDNLTNIANINAVFSNEGVVYDLQGRKVAKPAKGLYIVNGRKVIIK